MLEHAVYQDLHALVEELSAPLETLAGAVAELLHGQPDAMVYRLVNSEEWDSTSLERQLNLLGQDGFKVVGVTPSGQIILQKEQR